MSWPWPPLASTASICKALISPAKRALAAASAAAPSDSKITIAGVLAASWAVNAMPAGVALSRASSQKSPTLGGSSGSSGFTGTYAGAAPEVPSERRSETPPGRAHDGSGVGAGGSVLDITLHLTASHSRGRPQRRAGHGESIRPFRRVLASSGSARMAMNAEANRFHSWLWVQSQFGVCPGS